MGSVGKRGYSGGKFEPKEKDLISGIVLAKSLQAFDAINIDLPLCEKVENINQQLKIIEESANEISIKFFLKKFL
jgi:hypothetical protein